MICRLVRIALLVIVFVPTATSESGEPARTIDFVTDVQPILRRHCDRCHGSRNQEAGLRLDRREAVFSVADSGEPIVIPGSGDESLLIRRVESDADGDVMPLDGQPLSPQEIAKLRSWIEQGAAWPEAVESQQHWAYQPIRRIAPATAETENPIDYFVKRKLRDRALSVTSPLDRPRLIRRVSLALTGVPPTPVEIDDFVLDASPNAYEQVVDRLLQSPRFGERWAVPWLDAARYADSNGFQADQLRHNWAYRDWVIRAFNADLPIDQFIIDQIAGDLHEHPTIDQKVATGFHRMTTCNVEAGVHPEANRVNQIVDRVNTTATVFLGTTFECAQCHDHKYDPFTMDDYYRMFAYFNNTPLEVEKTSRVTWDFYGPTMEVPSDEAVTATLNRVQTELKRLRTERQRLSRASEDKFQTWLAARNARQTKDKSDRQLRDEFDRTQPKLRRVIQRIDQLRNEIKGLQSPSTLVMVEMDQPRETFVMIRGDYENLGSKVAPGTPANLPPIAPAPRGDRMGLASWLASENNPLTARVLVNRWWAEIFGRGIVSTVEDFGTQGDPPTHPQLLDFLASELIDSGWSMKQLLKLIVMSEAFQRSADASPLQRRADPENRWLARGPRFRLPAELVRDNALAISGLLSDRMFGPPVMPYQPDGIWRSVGRNQPKWQTATDEERFRRGVYVVWKRAAPYPSFVTFDAPNRSSCTVTRSRSNTPLQALTLLNDPAYVEMALAFADRILSEAPQPSDLARIEYAMRLATMRRPSDAEVELLMQLLDEERRLMESRPALAGERTAPLADSLENDPADTAAWFAVASVLLNLDEVIQQ